MQVDAPSSTAASTRDRMKILSFRYSGIRTENSQYRKGAPDDNEASELRSVECAHGNTERRGSRYCCITYASPAEPPLAIASVEFLYGPRAFSAILTHVLPFSCLSQL